MRFTILALAVAVTSVVADKCQCNVDKVTGAGGCDWDVDNDNCSLCIEDGAEYSGGKAPDCEHTISWSCGWGCDGTCQKTTCIPLE